VKQERLKRLKVVRALADSAEPAAIERLLALLTTERAWSVQGKIRVALTRQCRRHHAVVVAAARSSKTDTERLCCLQALTAAKSPAVFDLWVEYYVHHEVSFLRAYATDGIRRLRDPRGARYLLELARDPDGSVRKTAVEALGAVRGAELLPAVVDALSDPEREVSFAAMFAVAKFGEAGWHAVMACIRSQGPTEPRLAAVTWFLTVTRSIPWFEELLAAPEPALRRAALRSLNAWGQRFAPDEMRERIGQAAADPDASVRCQAVLALRWFATTAGARAALQRALDDPDPAVRAMALDSIALRLG